MLIIPSKSLLLTFNCWRNWCTLLMKLSFSLRTWYSWNEVTFLTISFFRLFHIFGNDLRPHTLIRFTRVILLRSGDAIRITFTNLKNLLFWLLLFFDLDWFYWKSRFITWILLTLINWYLHLTFSSLRYDYFFWTLSVWDSFIARFNHLWCLIILWHWFLIRLFSLRVCASYSSSLSHMCKKAHQS